MFDTSASAGAFEEPARIGKLDRQLLVEGAPSS
jgi:hypothetical protein